jgi:hypothetical protein
VLQAVTIPVLGDEQCQYETGLPLYNDQAIKSFLPTYWLNPTKIR